jgi:hypothetical protein
VSISHSPCAARPSRSITSRPRPVVLICAACARDGRRRPTRHQIRTVRRDGEHWSEATCARCAAVAVTFSWRLRVR